MEPHTRQLAQGMLGDHVCEFNEFKGSTNNTMHIWMLPCRAHLDVPLSCTSGCSLTGFFESLSFCGSHLSPGKIPESDMLGSPTLPNLNYPRHRQPL